MKPHHLISCAICAVAIAAAAGCASTGSKTSAAKAKTKKPATAPATAAGGKTPATAPAAKPAPSPAAPATTPAEVVAGIATPPPLFDSGRHVDLPRPHKPERKANPLLDKPAQGLGTRADKLGNVLRAIGRDYGLTFIIPRELDATTISYDYVGGGSVRDLLTTVTASGGVYFDDNGSSIIRIKRLKTVIYYIEYPSVTRTSNGSSSVSISGGSGSGLYNGGTTGSITSPIANPTAAGAANQLGAGRTGMDQNSFTLTSANDGDIWTDITAALNAAIDGSAGEKVTVEKRSGIAKVTATPDRHEEIKEYIDSLNHRINQQVHVSVKILEVTLRNENSLGVDWSQVATHIAGGASLEGLPGLGSIALKSTTSGAKLVGAQSPQPTTQVGLSFGKLHALVSALEQQGKVSSTSNPEISTLTNQTAYLKVGQDQPFYSATQSASILTPTVTTGTGLSSVTTYGERTQTFGTILQVTPHVAEDGLITLDVQPVITRYVGEKFSPDNLRSDAITEIQAAASVYQLHDGETGLLGGFIYDNTTTNDAGIPGTRKINVIKNITGTTQKSGEHSEVIILITAWLGSHGARSDSELSRWTER